MCLKEKGKGPVASPPDSGRGISVGGGDLRINRGKSSRTRTIGNIGPVGRNRLTEKGDHSKSEGGAWCFIYMRGE